MKKIGFIGCGNMGGALALAVSKAKTDASILLCDANTQKAEQLAARIGGTVVGLKDLALESDCIFIGVKPQGLDALFLELRPYLFERKTDALLVSMAAGITIEHIERIAAAPCPVIRIMPNTPVSVGKGMILYDVNGEVTPSMEEEFCALLSAAGVLDRLSEVSIDAASALSGCGPAFVFLFAEALADGAVACGLPREKANLYAAQTLLGSAALLLESGKHPGELKDAVCSPGGTTIEGVHALECGAFRASTAEAVIAAYQKTLQLKK
ncbi:MAG: pyrroline-5-carboxylate reductase [Clostridia bacterium]|nr:pyrroline-5-carboxylate reductase [Clostridia bacterium]